MNTGGRAGEDADPDWEYAPLRIPSDVTRINAAVRPFGLTYSRFINGLGKAGLVVEPPSAINSLEPDAVLVTTVRHAAEIQLKMRPSLRASVEVWEL